MAVSAKKRASDAAYRERHREAITTKRQQNKAQARRYAKEYQTANAEKIREKKAKGYKENRDVIKAKRSAYYLENRDTCISYARDWRANNPDTMRLYNQDKRARKMIGSEVGRLSLGLSDLLMSEQGGKCPYCLVILAETGYQLDHFFPLALGGLHHDDNIQLTCEPCNSRKRSKHPAVFLLENGLPK